MAKEKKQIEKSDELKALIENSVSLQKILTDLAIDVNSLTRDVKQMLNLFEEASKAFKEGKPTPASAGEAKIEEMNAKMTQLIEQNRIIAKGIVLLESFLKEKGEAGAEIPSTQVNPENLRKFRPKPLPEYRY